MMSLPRALCALALLAGAPHADAKAPSVLWVVADDLGYSDVSYHGAEFPTPALDVLAADGVRLERYYVQEVCSPSRSAFMTGVYPLHTGLQHIVIWQDANASSLPHMTVAERLRAAGTRHVAHAIGKWHNGHASAAMGPLARGFDFFYGWNGGGADYTQHHLTSQIAPYSGETHAHTYTHTHTHTRRPRAAFARQLRLLVVERADPHHAASSPLRPGEHDGYTMFDGATGLPDWNARGVHTTDLWRDKAVAAVGAHDFSRAPLLTYLAFQVRAGRRRVAMRPNDARSSLASR